MRGVRVKRAPSVGLTCWIGLGLLACDDARSTVALNTVRDSAGVRIVESRSDSRYQTSWTLGEVPVWAVGQLTDDPDYLFSRVVGATQLPNGTIVVANGGTNELRFYSSDGTLVRSEGREGQGPGEFQYMRGLGLCSEEGFIAFDLNWEMNSYHSDGTFIDRQVFRAPSGITPYNLACDPHGHVLLIGWGRDAAAGPQVGFFQARDRLVLTSRDGDGETDFGERLVSERWGTPNGSRPHPAGRATRFALHGDEVFVGTGERFEVEVRDLSNSLLALLRGPSVNLEITDSIKSAYLEGQLAAAPAERHPRIRRNAEAMDWPEAFPAFVDLKVDSEGILWLLAYSTSRVGPQVWSLLDPNEGYLGDLQLPPRHSLLEAGSDYLLLLTKDDLDVERLVKLTLNRRNAA